MEGCAFEYHECAPRCRASDGRRFSLHERDSHSECAEGHDDAADAVGDREGYRQGFPSA